MGLVVGQLFCSRVRKSQRLRRCLPTFYHTKINDAVASVMEATAHDPYLYFAFDLGLGRSIRNNEDIVLGIGYPVIVPEAQVLRSMITNPSMGSAEGWVDNVGNALERNRNQSHPRAVIR